MAASNRPDQTAKQVADWHIETKLAQSLGVHCASTGAVVPPISLSTIFARDEHYNKPDGRGYIRDDNPGYLLCEELLRQLEQAQACMVFPSGAAAFSACFQVLPVGARVVVQEQCYFGLPKWLRQLHHAQRLAVTFVPTGDMDALAAALQHPAALVWIETPANPALMVTDIAAAAALAHAAGAKLCVDSTVATPLLTRPLSLGADLVCHSATKYLNGHSDVLAGALLCREPDEYWQALREHRYLTGAMLGSVECYLLVRGLKTLHVRMAQHCRNAETLAEFLCAHPQVQRVAYPGLPPLVEVARQQMHGGFGGLMAVFLHGGSARCRQVLGRLRIIRRATSLGGTESLIEHRHSVEGDEIGTPENLLRFSVGLENPADLIADLEQALG